MACAVILEFYPFPHTQIAAPLMPNCFPILFTFLSFHLSSISLSFVLPFFFSVLHSLYSFHLFLLIPFSFFHICFFPILFFLWVNRTDLPRCFMLSGEGIITPSNRVRMIFYRRFVYKEKRCLNTFCYRCRLQRTSSAIVDKSYREQDDLNFQSTSCFYKWYRPLDAQ